MTDHHAPGIYFNLSEDAYFADPALGSSSIKQLLINPVAYWAQSPNGKAVLTALGLVKEDDQAEESLAQQFGTAAHVMVLEPERFEDAFIEHEDAPPDYLTSRDVIRGGLERAGAYLPPRSAGREEYVMAAKRAGLKVIDDWQTDFLIKAAGRKVLSRRWAAQLRMIDHLMRTPRADLNGKSIREDTLTGGASEVSVFWIEDGVRLKARFDYMRRQGIVDLKTYACPTDANPVAFFLGQVARYGYDLQAACYRAAWEALAGLIAQGRVYGAGGYEDDLIDRLRTDQPPAWRWLAVQTMGLPEVDRIDFQAPTALSAAEIQRQQALAAYRQYVDRFGLDEPWVSMRGRIVADDPSLDATGVARRMSGRGETTWSVA